MIARLCGAGLIALSSVSAPAQSIDAGELAGYRLTAPVLERFARASRLIADLARTDAALRADPLFSREIAVSGDAVLMARRLEARLRTHPPLARALDRARIGAREYTTFALALFAARMAHGFVESGALRRVPPGVPTDNVRFVGAHHTAILAILRDLGLEEPASAHPPPPGAGGR